MVTFKHFIEARADGIYGRIMVLDGYKALFTEKTSIARKTKEDAEHDLLILEQDIREQNNI
tara:strand:- start:450 stop:632 length:183 start_codon:yes stop_codon:yes gene_type:complete